MRPVCIALAALAIGGLAFGTASATARVGVSGFTMAATAEGGGPVVQAGQHPIALKTTLALAEPLAEGGLRDLEIALPPGLIENPAAVPTCGEAAFRTPRSSPFESSRSGESCPDKSQVGVITLRSATALRPRSFGLFNVSPPTGAPAMLGASPYGDPLTLVPHIRTAEGQFGISLDLREADPSLEIEGLEIEIWGTPWAISHNTRRGDCLDEAAPEDPWAKCSVGRPQSNPAVAYLSMPSSCTGPLIASAAVDSWSRPGDLLPDGEPDLSDPAWAQAEALAGPQLTGCDHLLFDPAVTALPGTDRAASPIGFDLDFATEETGLLDPRLLAPSQPRRAVVSLPEGMTLNPSVAAGLAACSSAQFAAETVSAPPGAGCPNASRIGDFTVESPLYGAPILGSLFLAAPHDNPSGQMLALYVVAKAPARGVIVKVAGYLEADPVSGRLTAVFEGLPQLPYTHFHVHFREGQRSPLLSPGSCGSYVTTAALTPWIEAAPPVIREPGFKLGHGVEGGQCPAAGAPPFAPQATGGDLNPVAGAYSAFYLHMTRRDTEQEITSYSAQLPPGLLARIAGIPFCPDSAIEAAKSMSGTAEEEHPSCPAASSIGHTTAGYGAGGVLAYAPGGLYLAGPYHGAPLSVVAIDSAKVGPFDFGVFVIRSAIEVDTRTAVVSIDSAGSDPIPHIRDGVPLHLRDIRVYVDRPDFTLNPTSCAPFTLTSHLTGAAAPFTSTDAGFDDKVPFQADDCSALGYRPKLTLSLKGKARRGAYPSLRAVLTPRAGDANIARAQVTLPPSEFLAQNHIGTICTRPQLEREACPSKSIYGHASAVTPLLGEPMTGPVYLRSSENPLPDLVAVLHGAGFKVVLEGRIDSAKDGGLRATFEGLPDAPVSRFTMVLAGGRRGLLVNEKNLCASPQAGTARLLGQADLGLLADPRVQVSCPGKAAGKRKGRHHKSKARPPRAGGGHR